MKPLTSASICTALLAVAPFALISCSQAPSGSAQATTAPAATTLVVTPAETAEIAAANPAPQHGTVLPVVLAPKPVPVYPVDMLRAREHGLVYVECIIDEAGRVVSTSIHDSTQPAFNAETERAVRRWTFRPGTRDGVPTMMRVLVPVEYVDREVSSTP